jgi:HEAT repeat protein
VWGLVKALCHRKDGVREDAARALGEIAESLIDGLGTEGLYMRQAVVEGLFQLRDARVVEPLIAALKNKNDGVRTAAAKALGKISAAR